MKLTFKEFLALLVIAGAAITLISNKESAKFVYQYQMDLKDRVNEECEEFSKRLFFYNKNPIGTGNISTDNFYNLNGNKIEWIKAVEKTNNIIFLSGKDLMDRCVKYHQHLFSSAFDLDKYPTSELGKKEIVDFYVIKITVNFIILATSLIISALLLKKIRKGSEGIFRVVIIFYFFIGLIPLIIPSHSLVATSATQVITFPTIFITIIYSLYLIIRWVFDGFENREMQLKDDEAKLQKQADKVEIERTENTKLKGQCPSCEAIIPLASLECPKCKAMFGMYSTWKVLPLK